MYKACTKCGRIHDTNHRCYKGESQYRRKNTQANNFRKSYQWICKSEQIRKDSNFLCSVCRSNDTISFEQLEVHHIEPLEENVNRGLDNYNLICLCNECHRQAEAGLIERNYLFQLAKAREENTSPPTSDENKL